MFPIARLLTDYAAINEWRNLINRLKEPLLG